MGSRASYVIIKNGVKKYYYHHWGAQRIPKDMFWGSEVAIPYIESLHETDSLLDNTWCEGAVVVDRDSQNLMLFGGEDIVWSNTLKRVYLALLRITWKEWSIKWAKNRIYSIAQEIGDSSDKLIDPNPALDLKLDLTKIKNSMQWDGAIISIKRNGIIKHIEMDFEADAVLSQGENILSMLECVEATNPYKQTPNKEYVSFLYIDTDASRIFYDNEFARHYKIYEVLSSIWKNWVLTEHNQGMYRHAILCGLDWREYVADQGLFLDYLKNILLSEIVYDPADTVKALTDRGYDVEVSTSLFFQKDDPAIEIERKRNILSLAIKNWQKVENQYEKSLNCEIW